MKLYKRMQKRLALAVVATTVFTSVGTPVFAADYDGHWAAQAIAEWKDKGVIGGYEDGSFRPKQNVTRAELAAMLVRVFGLTETKGAETFSDVKSSDWYAADIAKVSAAGIMHTDGASFRPNSFATREEAAYAIAKAYKVTGSGSKTFKDQNGISTWAEDEVAALVGGGYISGRPDGTFAPKDALTRADLVTMIDKITAQLYNKAGEYSENVSGNTVINTKDVVLKDMTIDGNLYIAEGVGDGDVTLEDVVVKGEVFVEGGGVNSIKLKGNTSLNKVTVDKASGEVRLVTSGNAKVEQVTVESGVRLEGQFGEVTVANRVAVEVLANSTIGKLEVSKNAAGSSVKLASGVTVQEATLNGEVTVEGNGKITNVTLGDGVKASDVSLKVSVGSVQDSTGKDVTLDTTKPSTGGSTSGSTGGSSGGSDSPSVVSNYRIQGQLTIDGKPINYGDSKNYGVVRLVPYVVVNGDVQEDESKAIIVEANSRGGFDFGRVAKGKNYIVYGEYRDINGTYYESEGYKIEKLNSNQSIKLDLIEVKDIIVHDVEVTSESQIKVTMDKMGEVRAYIADDAFNGVYTTEWEDLGDKQVTTVTLPEGKKLEVNKEYTLVLWQPFYNDKELTVVWNGQTETPEEGKVNKAELEAVIKEANILKETTKVSVDGKDIAEDQNWVTKEVMDKFESAITTAQSVDVNEKATQDQVDAAEASLKTAVTEFKGKMQLGTKVEVTNSIKEWEVTTTSMVNANLNGLLSDMMSKSAEVTYTNGDKKEMEIEWAITTTGSVDTPDKITTTGTYTVVGKLMLDGKPVQGANEQTYLWTITTTDVITSNGNKKGYKLEVTKK